MTLLQRAADKQLFDLTVGQGFERFLRPGHGQSPGTILLHQPVHLFPAGFGFLLL